MGKKNPHLSDQFRGYHIPKPGEKNESTEGGHCLWGHNSNYEQSSCAYRWQAHMRAKDERESRDIYHRYRKASIPKKIRTSQYKTKKGGMYPSGYAAHLKRPALGDWDVDGPRRDNEINVPAGMNFTKQLWPYWHNSHHLIPKGTLHSRIEEETRTAPEIGIWIKQSLLASAYNVNYKVNMMILPQDREVAKVLNLPRHLTQKHSDSLSGPDCFDHKVYGTQVAIKLTSIISDFKKKYDEAVSKNEHPDPDSTLEIAKLTSLSKNLFSLIKHFGARNQTGASLDSIKFNNIKFVKFDS